MHNFVVFVFRLSKEWKEQNDGLLMLPQVNDLDGGIERQSPGMELTFLHRRQQADLCGDI